MARLKVPLKSVYRGLRQAEKKLKSGLARSTSPQRSKLKLYIDEIVRCEKSIRTMCGDMDIEIVIGDKKKR